VAARKSCRVAGGELFRDCLGQGASADTELLRPRDAEGEQKRERKKTAEQDDSGRGMREIE
jgi:hypothetical protein